MNTTEAIRARRSIRRFKENREIPEADIDLMLEAAMMAPSAKNTRPWEFVVVRDQAKRDEIASVLEFGKMIPKASLAIIVCGRPDLQPDLGGMFYPTDCAAAAENILLQAVELGYGTCWCGVWPREQRIADLQKVLDVTSVPYCAIAVGVADQAPAARGFYDKTRVKYF